MSHSRKLVASLSRSQLHLHLPFIKEAGLGLVAACLAIFVVACGTPASQPPPSVARLSAAETIVTAIVAEVTKLQRKTVAVIEFSELSGTAYVPSPKGRLLTERITTQLVSSGKVEVVERAQLDKVIGELKLGVSGMFDDAKPPFPN